MQGCARLHLQEELTVVDPSVDQEVIPLSWPRLIQSRGMPAGSITNFPHRMTALPLSLLSALSLLSVRTLSHKASITSIHRPSSRLVAMQNRKVYHTSHPLSLLPFLAETHGLPTSIPVSYAEP